MTSLIATRVVCRYLWKMADQPPGQRKRVREMARPINAPAGVGRKVIKEDGKSKSEGEDVTDPDRRDIQPRDVFWPPLPKNVSVRNLAETGRDFSDAESKVEKEPGSETVSLLSQYLVKTEGGGEGGPVGEGKK